MDWREIKVSENGTHFLIKSKPAFNKRFLEVLKFHAPGLAPVKDDSGSYHIDTFGIELYSERYTRTFGFYCNRASVVQNSNWFHIDHNGERAYGEFYSWVGNFQENRCPVRDGKNYFHIDLLGNRIYPGNHVYCGDFKDGIACVKTSSGVCRHIDAEGNFINGGSFIDLGIFHKNIATAKDGKGWYHINRNGNELYSERYLAIEPFYNGFALATALDGQKTIIDETGQTILKV